MTFLQAKKLIKKIYTELGSVPAVSGDEELCAHKVKHILSELTDFFDGFTAYPAGGMLFTHRCGDKNAKKLLIDAHFDTVGFTVTEILDGGFLRVSPVGGDRPQTAFCIGNRNLRQKDGKRCVCFKPAPSQQKPQGFR